MSHPHPASGLPPGLDDPFAIRHRRRQGFLDQDVRVRLQRRHRHVGMSAGRRADVDEVGAFLAEHFADVGISRRNAESAAHRFGAGAVLVADGDDSHVAAQPAPGRQVFAGRYESGAHDGRGVHQSESGPRWTGRRRPGAARGRAAGFDGASRENGRAQATLLLHAFRVRSGDGPDRRFPGATSAPSAGTSKPPSRLRWSPDPA